jgi:hypothetical protein
MKTNGMMRKTKKYFQFFSDKSNQTFLIHADQNWKPSIFFSCSTLAIQVFLLQIQEFFQFTNIIFQSCLWILLVNFYFFINKSPFEIKGIFGFQELFMKKD